MDAPADHQIAVTSNVRVDEDARRNRLTDLIDFELARSDAADARAGWSKWALVGALGTLGWLILGELRDQSLQWSLVVWTVLCASILQEVFSDLDTVLEGSSKRGLGQPRFLMTNRDLRGYRATFAGQLARFGVLLLAATVVVIPGPAWTRMVLLIYLYLMSTLAVLGLLITFVPLPLARVPPATNVILIPSLIRLALVITLAAGFALALTEAPQLLHAAEVRLGALLWAAGFVAILLVNASPTSPLTVTLGNIRRDLSLGVLDVETAEREVDIALRGLKVADLLQEDVGRLLEIWRDAIARLDAASAKLALVVDALPQSDEPLSPAEQHKARVILEELRESDEKAAQSLKALRTALSKFKATASRIVSSTYFLGVNVRGDLIELAEKIDHMQKLHNAKAEELLRTRDALVRRSAPAAGPVQG